MGSGMNEASKISITSQAESDLGYGAADDVKENDRYHSLAFSELVDSFEPQITPPLSPIHPIAGCVTVPVTPNASLEQHSVMLYLTDSERRRRRYLHAIANAALVQELLFLFFQFSATRKGLTNLGVNDSAAAASAICLSLADWMMNVLAVSVPTDADAVLWSKEAHLSRAWDGLATAIKGLSLVGSYSVGAAADALPLLNLVPQDWPVGALAVIHYALIVANILPGASYYRLFNHTKIFNHLKVFREFSQDPTLLLRRLMVRPINGLRYFEVSRAWLTVVGYRSISFAFIAQALAPYLLKPMGLSTEKDSQIGDVLAIFALTATAVNVMFSRLLPVYEQLAAVEFDVVSPAEYRAAVRQWRREAFSSWRVSATTLLRGLASLAPNAVTAAGWLLLAGDVFEIPWQQALLQTAIGGVSLANHSWVEYQALISRLALSHIPAALEDNDVAVRLQRMYGLNSWVSQGYSSVPDSDTSVQGRLQVVDHHFEQLKRTFEHAHPMIDTAMVAVNVAARAARCIGFYGFIKTLSATLSTYTGVEISEQQNIALCLILAPENFKNELAVFDESMKSVIQNWHAKCYIETHALGRTLSTAEAIRVCLVKSPYDYSLSDIKQALQRRASETAASPLFPPPNESSASPLRTVPAAPSTLSRLSACLPCAHDSACAVM